MSIGSRSRALGTCIAGLLLVLASPLAGAAHDIPVDGATLAGPAVVWVRASVETGVVVLEHEREITIHTGRFMLPMRSGSGMVVNHNGTVATAASVIATDLQKARIHAINKAFAAVHHLRIADPFKRQHLRDARLDAKLRTCYGSTHHRECIVTGQTRVIEVFPWTRPASAKGLPAQVLPSKASNGVAILQINGPTNMPSAALASTGDVPERATILGFSGPPRADSSPGRMAVTRGEMAKLKLKPGLSGGPVVDESGRMVGLVAAPGEDGAGQASFHPAAQVAAALRAARIEPQRSVVDSTFEEAIRYYRGHHDRHAVDRFDKVLSFYPKHALAIRLRDDARTHAGTPEDLSGAMDEHGMPMEATADGRSLAPWIVAGIVGLLALAGAAVLWRRRRLATAPAGEAPPAAPPAEHRSTAQPMAPVTPVVEPRGNGQSTGERHATERTPARPQAGSGARSEQAAETRVRPAPPSPSRFAFCTQCGKPSNPGHRFCGYCGNRFA